MSALVVAAVLSAAPAQSARWARVVAALQLVAEEYFEALELSDKEAMRARHAALAELLARTAPLVPAADVRAEVIALRARISAVDYKLGDDCRALIGRILDRAQLRRWPRTKPDLARGRKLYAQACAACHGAGATGESAIAATMDPRPGNILHPEYNWSPWDLFNRIAYGGAQTAMPAFDEGLSESQRWDIVFWLFAERWPPCTKPLPQLRADELSLLGDFELGNRFGYGAAACLRRRYLPPKRR